MANYNRVKVWSDGDNLTAADLNAEFDAIKAIINGNLDITNFSSGGATSVATNIYVNAGDPRFQTGALDDAELVGAAIAEAAAGTIKTVFIPRTLFGYAGATSFGSLVFDTTILMVREGQTGAGHDPIAYGAKPDDATVDDQPSFLAAMNGASASIIGSNPGGGWVELTLPGGYRLDSNVLFDADVGYIEFPGTTVPSGGAGAITSPTTDADKHGIIPFKGLVNLVITDVFAPNVPLSSTTTQIINQDADPADYVLLAWRLDFDEDGGAADELLSISEGVTLTGITTNFDLEMLLARRDAGGNQHSWSFNITNNDGGSAHVANMTFTGYYVKVQAL